MRLRPDAYFASVLAIDVDWLKGQGVDAVFLDLDNTILPRGHHVVPMEIVAWIEGLQAAGLQVSILSNSNKPKVKACAMQLGLPVIQGAHKPLKTGYRRALAKFKCEPDRAAIVGDQSYTDILGAHRMGMKAYMVAPLSTEDLWHTRLLRSVDRIAVRGMEAKS